MFGFRLPRPDVIHRKMSNVLPEDWAGLDHNGFEYAVRPTESDPIRPCFVSKASITASVAAAGDLRRIRH